MKKTLSMMILAGVLATSLASCVVQGGGDPVPTGTEPYYQVTTNTPPTVTTPLPSNDPTSVVYAPVDETVYIVSKNASLKSVENTANAITLGATTELHRIGKSTSWSKVEYNGAAYYIASSLLTTDDLGEKTFTSCDKTLYVKSGSVNVRFYASAEDFSEILGTRQAGDAIKVIAENGTWSKIEWTEGANTKKGFIKTSLLSDTQPSVSDTEFLKHFTLLDEPATMYVSAETANLRMKPYGDDRGTLVDPDGLPKGTAVTVIARGTVENVAWSMVEWKVGTVKEQYYIATKYLSVTAQSAATLDQMLKAYPELVAFEAAKDLYISVDQAFGRSTPTRIADENGNASNAIKMLYKKNSVKAVASGRIEGQAPDGTSEFITWCLIQDSELGFYFVAYSNLTPNADGTPAPIPVSLDQLVANYGFTKLPAPVAMTVKEESDVMNAPDASSVATKLAQGTAVSVVARGQTGDFVKNDWYIIEYEGTYYFIIQGQLELAA